VGDCPNKVKENRNDLAELLPADCKIQWLDKVHGNHVVIINEQVDTLIKADAMITQSSKIALAIMTADCLPILFCNENGTEIAAIHGGWRCLADDIIFNTLAKMQSRHHDLHVWLGPCIGSKAFEVGEEVKTTFIKKDELFNQAFTENSLQKNKYFANLQLIAKIQLQQLGIKNITSLSDCTYSKKEKYFSFRRDKTTGRMATLICRN